MQASARSGEVGVAARAVPPFEVKLAAKSLLERLTNGKPKVLVREWFKDTQSKKRVANAVEEVLHANLPESYDRSIFKTKCDEVLGLVLDHASHGRKWAA